VPHFPSAFEINTPGHTFKTRDEFTRRVPSLIPAPDFVLNVKGDALKDVLSDLMNVPRPHNSASEFTWYGDTARTIATYLVNKYDSES
jgi:hypothetical protein